MSDSLLKMIPPVPCKASTTTTTLTQTTRYQPVSPFEVFNACVNDLTGKDKIAKIVQYVIRLLAAVHETHGLGNKEVADRILTPTHVRVKKSSSPLIGEVKVGVRTAENAEMGSPVTGYSTNFNQKSPLLMLGQILPILAKVLGKYACLLSINGIHKSALLMLAYLTSKLSLTLQGLNIYRHLLRAGTMPFRIWKFYNHIKYSLRILLEKSLDGHAVRIEKIVKYWTSKDMISQMVNLWYALSDEILLAYRFKILIEGKNGTPLSNAVYTWAEDHELYSWMGSILLGLNNDWGKWLTLKSKESRIILNRKVKARTRRIVGDMRSRNGVAREVTPDLEAECAKEEEDDDDEEEEDDDDDDDDVYYEGGHHDRYVDELTQVREEMHTVKINAIRLTCDMIFDAKYIMHWNMSKPIHVSLGLISGSLGLYNTYRAKRAALEEQRRS